MYIEFNKLFVLCLEGHWMSSSPLVRIGISIYEVNLGEPTLIYVHTCFGSPEKSKSLHKGLQI